jgi:hypothetical protein
VNELTVPITSEDAAWASVNTPLKIDELTSFCQDIERLFRINPMLEFSQWQNLADGQYRMAVKNISQQTPFELETELRVENQDESITIHYSNGAKKKTVLKFEPAAQGSRLTIIDDYTGLSEEERHSRLHEVDKSLVNWAEYLQRYIIMWRRWSRFTLWRWYMRHIWQPMKPSGRRITYILLWISAVEIALLALGATIYFIEYAD